MPKRVLRGAAICAALLCTLSATMKGQPRDQYLHSSLRVLDLVFPTDVAPSYYLKLIMRFGDSDTQLAIVVYPGGRSELIRYTLAGVKSGELPQVISKMVAENPAVTDQEIAASLKVEVTRSELDHKALNRALRDLKAIRISPILATRIAVDEYSEYEYWCDTGQESVHYVITGPGVGSAQDRLVQWMLRFRANAPNARRRDP